MERLSSYSASDSIRLKIKIIIIIIIIINKGDKLGNSLVVQWLGLSTSVPCWGIKILHAVKCSQA